MTTREGKSKTIEDSLKELLDADEDVVRNALSAGPDLHKCSEQIKEELREARKGAVEECLKNADKLTDLHTQIIACDHVFEKLENMLIGFQKELGSLSDDMSRLQEQSVSIGIELENRQKVRGHLSQFVDDLVVSQTMIKAILEADPNDRIFLEQLHELQHKLQFLRAQEFKEAKAVADVQQTVEALKCKALEKIREWLLQKIYQFRKPLANYQVTQHQMLKNRFFYEFLLANERNIAKEIQDEYVDTISKMFFSYFKTYTSRLFKLMMTDCATRDDLIGVEDTVKSSGFFSSKPTVRNRATVFSLGSRHTLLAEQFNEPIIVPHAASESGQKFQFESLFRSVQLALVEHVTHEYVFVCDFFLVSGPTATDLHARVLGRAIAQLVRDCDERTTVNFDAISLYLCICLAEKFLATLKARNVPPMQNYWEAVAGQLWARFEQIMSLHNESVKQIDVRKMQPPVDTRPHYIVRRYAELTCALLVITDASGKQVAKRLETLLEAQEDVMEQLLSRMAATMSQQREKLVFLINNYDLILQILDERVAHDSHIHQIIHELEQKAINEFVETTLAPYFAPLISFVNECESLVSQQHNNLLVRYTEKLSTVIRSFAANWKRSIDSMNGDVLKSFTNFKNGTEILQNAFNKLVQYYQRFVKIAAHDVFRDVPARQEMINLHVLVVELKKHKPIY